MPCDSSADDTSSAAMLSSAFTAMVRPISCCGEVIPDRGRTTISSTRGPGVSVRQDVEPSGPVYLCFDEPGVGPIEDVDAAVEAGSW